MKSKLKISVITPSYNSGKHIERAIKSVLDQDYGYWEHIIVDGGSSDGTIDTLQKYPHLKWLSKKDNGQADAMNKGFKISSGEIIVYLNADDYFLPKAFSRVITHFIRGEKFVMGNVLIKSPRLKAEFINEPRTTLKGMLRHWEPNAFCHNPVGYFYLREVQEKCPFNPNNKFAMDLEFLLDAASKYNFTKVNYTLGCFEDGINTKTGQSQSKLDYWQPSNFPYVDKYLGIFDPDEKIQYQQDRRNGYCAMQTKMNKDNIAKILMAEIKQLPKVSVIIPTYNDAEHLPRAIDSALNQTYKNIEIIIVNDSSTDNTNAVLQKYAKHKHVRSINNKHNIKLGASRNKGIDAAKGEYVYFIDSDDWIEPETLDYLVNIAESYDLEIVAHGINKVFEDGRIQAYHGYDFGCRGGIEALQYLSEYKIASVGWNKLYLKRFLDKHKIRFTEKYWHEDVLFTLNTLWLCNKYLSITSPFYNYFQRPSSIINGKKDTLHLQSYFRLILNINDFIEYSKLRIDNPQLAEELFHNHAFVDFSNNLKKYKLSSTESTWLKDLTFASTQEFGNNGIVMAHIIESLLEDSSKIIVKSDNKKQNTLLTEKELKFIHLSRKIKHKIIPENSVRKKAFELFRKFSKTF